MSELKRIASTLETEVDCVSSLLVRLLHVKDKRSSRAGRQSERLSAILKDYAKKNGKENHFRYTGTLINIRWTVELGNYRRLSS